MDRRDLALNGLGYLTAHLIGRMATDESGEAPEPGVRSVGPDTFVGKEAVATVPFGCTPWASGYDLEPGVDEYGRPDRRRRRWNVGPTDLGWRDMIHAALDVGTGYLICEEWMPHAMIYGGRTDVKLWSGPKRLEYATEAPSGVTVIRPVISVRPTSWPREIADIQITRWSDIGPDGDEDGGWRA